MTFSNSKLMLLIKFETLEECKVTYIIKPIITFVRISFIPFHCKRSTISWSVERRNTYPRHSSLSLSAYDIYKFLRSRLVGSTVKKNGFNYEHQTMQCISHNLNKDSHNEWLQGCMKQIDFLKIKSGFR